MNMGHSQKKRSTDKEIYQKSSYDSDVPSQTFPCLSPPFPKTSRTDLTPLPPSSWLRTSFMDGPLSSDFASSTKWSKEN